MPHPTWRKWLPKTLQKEQQSPPPPKKKEKEKRGPLHGEKGPN